MTAPIGPAGPDRSALPWYLEDVRRLACAATAGMAAGFLVNGIGGRLAMMLLARLNPWAAGVLSDDGFVMGRFDLGNTVGFVAQMTLLGILGGLLARVLRPLRFGPPWFRRLSWVLGPAVVVGSMLVHGDGVDFRVLQPLPLTVGLFVAIPGVYALVVVRLLDGWLAPERWPFTDGKRWMLGLAPLVATGPGRSWLRPGSCFASSIAACRCCTGSLRGGTFVWLGERSWS